MTPPGLPRADENSKPHNYKEKLQKMKDLSKTWISRKNSLKNFNGKKTFSLEQTTPWNTRPLKPKIEYGPCNQEEVNRIKFEKSIQIKTVETLQN